MSNRDELRKRVRHLSLNCAPQPYAGICKHAPFDHESEQAVTDMMAAFDAHIAAEVERAEGKARFEITYRLLLGAGGDIFVPKSMLEVPLTDYEITTYSSPDPSMPGTVYRLATSHKEVSDE